MKSSEIVVGVVIRIIASGRDGEFEIVECLPDRIIVKAAGSRSKRGRWWLDRDYVKKCGKVVQE
jgi:hypothetical protein